MDNGAPKRLHVLVRWGKSVLVNRDLRRVPARFDVVQDRAWLESRPGAVDLVTEEGRERIERGTVVRRQVGELTIVIDAQEVEAASFGTRPVVETRFAASDALSIALHAAILIGLVIWRAPLAETEQVPLPSIESERPLQISIGPATPLGPGDERADLGKAEDPGATGEPTPAGASGPGRSAPAATGMPYRGLAGEAHEAWEYRSPTLEDAGTFGMVDVLQNAYAMTPPSSPWAGDAATQAAVSGGPAWGAAWERGEGAGGLSLSGVGEGAGGQGAGVGVGSMGIGLGSLGSGLMSVGRPREFGEGFSVGRGRLGGSHRTSSSHRGCACGTSVSGRLPPETVQRIVRQSFGRFRQCYAAELVKNPGLVARVEMRFLIDRAGNVASVRGSGNGPEEMTRCVTRAFYSLAFPQPEGGVVNVTYPIAFSPE